MFLWRFLASLDNFFPTYDNIPYPTLNDLEHVVFIHFQDT